MDAWQDPLPCQALDDSESKGGAADAAAGKAKCCPRPAVEKRVNLLQAFGFVRDLAVVVTDVQIAEALQLFVFREEDFRQLECLSVRRRTRRCFAHQCPPTASCIPGCRLTRAPSYTVIQLTIIAAMRSVPFGALAIRSPCR